METKNTGFVISQTPFRISFFGGGTDLPSYFNEHGGQVLGTSIKKYMYVIMNSLPRFYEPRIRLSYSKLECVNSPEELHHNICRVILSEHQLFGINEFVDIHTFADLPASSGIGSSSTFTVGMLNALYTLNSQYRSPEQISREAIYIEREKLKELGGWQDQYFAAFGGFNHIVFNKDNTTHVQPIAISAEKLALLERSCYMVFTSATRSSTEIQKHFSQTSEEKLAMLHQTKAFVDEAMNVLYHSTKPSEMLSEFGNLLHQAWEVKRRLSSAISTTEIDAIYEAAISAGAYGGKICGAGGGGFILLICPDKAIANVRSMLKNYHIIDLAFDSAGSRPLYNKLNHTGNHNHEKFYSRTAKDSVIA